MAINYTALATGALGFAVALAWNDAVSRTIKSFFPPADERAAARASLVYALVVTLLVIFIVAVINHTRRIVHHVSGGSRPTAEALRGRTARAPDCASCAERCGFAPIVKLWQPLAK